MKRSLYTAAGVVLIALGLPLAFSAYAVPGIALALAGLVVFLYGQTRHRHHRHRRRH